MGKLSLTRRSFVKMTAAAGAAAALTGFSQSALAEDYTSIDDDGEIKRIRTGCRACGKMECGVVALVQDGKVIRIEGDEGAFQSMGNCCTKSQSAVQAAYHPDRLHYPQKRTNAKDDNDPGWVRIDWDEAVTTICGKYDELQEKYGGESLFGLCGTSRVWCMFGASNGMWLWDSPNIAQAWQICKGPRHFASLMVSTFTDPWMETVFHPDVYVAWGGGSEMSNYDDSCRTTVDVASRAQTHICVDPRISNMGKEADYQLHLRPGTDGAMALAWTNVVIENELYDDLFTKKWTNAPFLVVEEGMEKSGFTAANPVAGLPTEVNTRLLKESDIKKGGSPERFMVWDTLAGTDSKHPTHENSGKNNGNLTYYDSVTRNWEGETWVKPTEGTSSVQEHLAYGFHQGFVPDATPFDPEIDPALFGTFEITLKDGKKVNARPVFELYAERCAEYTPEIVSEICEVDADMIREAATVYATRLHPERGYGNGGIQYMLATEHANTAIQNVRALDYLTAICGNYDTPAGQRASTRAPVEGGQMGFANNGSGMPFLSDGQIYKLLGREDIPLLDFWGMWADATTVYNAVNTGDPYPVRGCFNSSGNFMHQCNTDMSWSALLNMDFYAEANLWHTPGGTTCDVVLPAAHFLELSSPRSSQGASGAMGATCKCIEPPAEAKFDGEIIRSFYETKGLAYNVVPGFPEYPSYDQMLDMSVAGYAPCEGSWQKYRDMFQEHGWWDCHEVEPELWGTYRRYEMGYMRARNGGGFVGTTGDNLPGLYTITGKIEIFSLVAEAYHPDGKWDLATYTEPPHSYISDPEMFKEYPMNVTTGRRIPVYFHSEHRQLPWCRELWPVPRVEINPEDAANYGIEQGDWVWIETPYGKIREVADLYYGVKKGVINCEHQWWFPELEQAGKGHELCAVNHLIDPWARDPHCGASNLRAYLAKIYKATPENSPYGNPCPCGVDGKEIIHDSSDPRLQKWLPTYEGRV